MPPVELKDVVGGGLDVTGTLINNEVRLRYKCGIWPEVGFLCPACAFEQLLKIIELHRKDVDGLLAGRHYNIEMEDK